MTSKKITSSPLWQPLNGPQTDALNSTADIVFYGGAAGGGKTDLLIGASITQHKRSIIFRREYSQLKAIIDRTTNILADCKLAKFNKADLIWTLEDKRKIELGAVQHDGDEYKYQGRPHDLKAFDELAHFTEAQFRMLCGWLRSTDANQRCRVLATGNPPTDYEGDWVIRFFAPWLDKLHAHPAKPGELRWFTTLDGEEIEVDEAPFMHNGERIVPKSRTFIPARVEDNPYYMKSGYKATLQALPEPLRAKLLYGDFSVGHEDNPFQLIPTDWLEAALLRHEKTAQPDVPLSCIGVDVARGGKDKTVITLRYANWFAPQRVYPGSMTPDGETVAQLALAARGPAGCKINVDVIGVGASVFDCLRRHIKEDAVALNAAQGSTARDRTGEVTFINRRAEWWWLLREALDPKTGESLALPPDRELLADLAAPHYRFTTNGVLVESKDNIIKRLGRSPDKGDSLVYAYTIQHTPAGGYLEFYAQRGWDF